MGIQKDNATGQSRRDDHSGTVRVNPVRAVTGA
jgi:hypothetical protein